MKEEWRDVIGCEGWYQVSNTGLVRSIKRVDWLGRNQGGKVLNPGLNKQGYYRVEMRLGSRSVSRRELVHRLVAEAFIGKCPPKYHVNHKNGKRHDNRLENLEIITAAENVRNGKRAKLSHDNVLEIREMLNSGDKQKDIANKYKVDPSTISDIATKRHWWDIS